MIGMTTAASFERWRTAEVSCVLSVLEVVFFLPLSVVFSFMRVSGFLPPSSQKRLKFDSSHEISTRR